MWVVATEVMLLAAVLLLKLVVDRWGPGGCVAWRVAVRRRGCLASPVRKVRAVVRPDLYGMNRDGVKMIFCRLRSAGGSAGR